VGWVFVRVIGQHTKEEFTFSPHTHKTKTKTTIKNPKNNIEKAKRREKKKTSKKK
jgi:hypothetical protein